MTAEQKYREIQARERKNHVAGRGWYGRWAVWAWLFRERPFSVEDFR